MEISVKIKKVFNKLKELYYFEIIFWLLIDFFLSDRSTQSFERRAMGNETFYWDGLSILKKIKTICAIIVLRQIVVKLKFE